MIAEVLMGLAKANLAGAAAVLVVLAARRPMRRALGARAAYALWLAPLLAGVAAATPHSGPTADVAPVLASAGAALGALPAPAVHPLLTPPLIGAAWLAGVLAAMAALGLQQAQFARAARAGLAGPAVIGVLRPRIVTPADFEARFAADERALILAHESAHLAVGDAAINALACAAQCLCWFNPLVHLGVRALRIDQELACDAAVIGRFPQARKTYAELLLKTQLAAQAPPLGCQWPAHAAHPLKERIAMLKSALPAAPARRAGLLAAALVGAAAAGLAWSASAQSAKLITRPDWAVRPVPADLAESYPAAALKVGTEGRATLVCSVRRDGRLAGCKVASESPAETGFGDAALKLSARFQMKPMSKDGVATNGGKVRIPIRFMLPQ